MKRHSLYLATVVVGARYDYRPSPGGIVCAESGDKAVAQFAGSLFVWHGCGELPFRTVIQFLCLSNDTRCRLVLDG